MSQEAMYAILLGIVFFCGIMTGAFLVLWTFAKDKTVQRVLDNQVVISREMFRQLQKKTNEDDD
jgi:hypothetical protein